MIFLGIWLLQWQLISAFVPAPDPVPDRCMEETDSMDLNDLRAWITRYKEFFLADSLPGEVPVWDLPELPRPERYTPQTEVYTGLPRAWSIDEAREAYDLYFSALRLRHTEDTFPSYIELVCVGERPEIPTVPMCEIRTIWYRDGSMDGSRDNMVTEGFGTGSYDQAIDSIEIMTYYTFVTAYEAYPVAGRQEIEDGSVEIIRLDGNRVMAVLTGGARYGSQLVALNREGRPLRELSARHWQRTADFDRLLLRYGEAFARLEQEAGRISEAEVLREKTKQTICELPPLWEPEGPPAPDLFEDAPVDRQLRIVYYEGNVDAVVLYRATGEFMDRAWQIIGNAEVVSVP